MHKPNKRVKDALETFTDHAGAVHTSWWLARTCLFEYRGIPVDEVVQRLNKLTVDLETLLLATRQYTEILRKYAQ